MDQLIGRKAEIQVLRDALASGEAEMVSVIGRRRVGKTFLVKSVCAGHIGFAITGVQGAPLQEQLSNFHYQLQEHSNTEYKKPGNWMEAFQQLIQALKPLVEKVGPKPVVFLDELPWLASRRSGFLRGLSFFWNSWAADQRIVVVVCGSAASWMIRKVVHHTGGLHNRITRRIFLAPFSLSETADYLSSRGVGLDHYQTTQIYMALGGIPHYLKEVKQGKSAAQNIDEICFSDQGLLRDEFQKLYPALFTNAEHHIAIIRALGKKWKGLTRKQIAASSSVPKGGTLKRVLEELEQSGFITAYRPFGKAKKGQLYRLTDEYSLFYLQFMQQKRLSGEGAWHRLSQTAAFKSWSGYAFENICLKHIMEIKHALGVAGVYTEASTYYHQGEGEKRGVQIDLLIDRNDHVINLFEIKFYNAPFTLTKAEAKALREKVALFQSYTQTKKQIFLSLITTFGLLPNAHSLGLVQQELTLEDLFNS
ncbi:AAA family ATPase [Phaeodactylibacter xiamenensis]|uniref:AAA family ATPase n=1 Tax=Phaeodactylibacter xiamenensis TaxID=1524460 RepID=UPI003CCC0940